MFIDQKRDRRPKLRRREMYRGDRRAANISLLRSFGVNLPSAFYKYFVPSGLVPLAIAIVICALAVINSRAHIRIADFDLPQSPQEQMQFPEGLDYGKFQHSSRNHSRLPCLLCHRRDSNAPIPKRPGASNHLPCAGCHAQQFSNISSCGTCHQLGGYSRTPEMMPAFRVSFKHAKHQKVTCNECHQVRAGQPQRRQMTTPEPLNHHATGRALSCVTCHDGKRAFGGEDFTVCKRCHTGATWRF